MMEFHFLRPWFLLTILPLLSFFWVLWQHSPRMEAWSKVCDSHLLKHLMHTEKQIKRYLALVGLFLSALCMSLGLSGPTWSRLPVPSYKQIQPRVLVVDLSNSMLANDLKPDRLTRAKFKLHDLFKQRDKGQFALVAYTGEPFVVSPLTDDANTIDSLLSSLSPEIMPVDGQQLDTALEEASQLIENAGYHQGQILVLTGDAPSLKSISTASLLAEKHRHISIMPILPNEKLNPLFKEFAKAGKGELVPFSDDSDDLDHWLNRNSRKKFALNKDNDIPVWRDQGRWFIFAALVFLLPVFRRRWLQRITS